MHGEQVVDLTPTEFKLVEVLAGNANKVFSRLQLVEQIQGYSFEGYERTVDAHIKNLRRKLEKNPKEPEYIQTVYGVGYKFAGDSHD
jgi:DNA-binding response OmpR family regulator